MSSHKRPPHTEAQTAALVSALKSLKDAFPGLSDRAIIEGPLARHVLGELPHWSSLDTHRLTNVMTALRGAFVLCWWKDADNETQVVIGARPKKGDMNDVEYNASGGGFANLDFTEASAHHPASGEGEQPAQTAARELCEEVRDDKGMPVLDLDPARFIMVSGGVDNRQQLKGGEPTDWYGHTVELTPGEAQTITRHCDRLAHDPAYLKACQDASHGETAFIKVMSLKDAAAIPTEKFAHPHEQTVITALSAQTGNKNKHSGPAP
jgi:hypothetical protein